MKKYSISLLTAGLIAGSSNGIHKIMSIFITFMDTTKEKRKEEV